MLCYAVLCYIRGLQHMRRQLCGIVRRGGIRSLQERVQDLSPARPRNRITSIGTIQVHRTDRLHTLSFEVEQS